MDKLFELGINDIDINNMIEQVPMIMDMDSNEISEKVDILKYILCDDRQIRDIISSNPYYLDRISSDVLKLINYLYKLGFNSLNLLFESNPYFLNYDVFEIEEYVNKRKDDGMDITDIVDEIDSNPYIIDEM